MRPPAHTLLLYLILSVILISGAVPARGAPGTEGDLEVVAAHAAWRGARVELTGPVEGVLSSSLDGESPRAAFWNLPSGLYRWRIVLPGKEIAAAEGRALVAPAAGVRVAVDAEGSASISCLDAALTLDGWEEAFRVLPGRGTEPIERMATFPDVWHVPQWEAMSLANPARRERVPLGLESFYSAAQLSFPGGGPPWASQRLALVRLGRAGGQSGLYAAGRADQHSRRDLSGRLLTRWPHILGGELEVLGRLRDDNDADPRSTVDTPRPHSDLLSLDLMGRYDLRGRPGTFPGWALWVALAARGAEREYLLPGYEKNADHSPREERAYFHSDVGLARTFGSIRNTDASATDWRHRLHVTFSYSRWLRETGDGVAFDVPENYGAGENDDTIAFGTLWRGDDPATRNADEGHIYNSYLIGLTNSFTETLGWDAMLGLRNRLSAQLQLTQNRVRFYEHFRPTQTILGQEGGFRDVRRFGYTKDALDREEASRLDVNEGVAGLQWRAAAIAGLTEAAIYGLWYRSQHRGPADWIDLPQSPDDPADPADILDRRPDTKSDWGGRLSHTISLARHAQVWAGAERRVRRPPLLALGLDRQFLVSNLYRLNPLGVPYGNPHLDPEIETWIQTGTRIGLAREAVPVIGGALEALGGGRRIHLQLGLYAAWTRQAWVERQVLRNNGPLNWIDDTGRRRLQGFHADLRSARRPPASGFWLGVSYDLSRLETRGGNPLALDQLWREPDLPLGSPLAREVTETFA
ncbi:MAG: hypothetical protein GF355_03525, partial [Candidatus Eisenbacteria bacterium]|nr:hypothetical protein [Candidatus Eisenbacteria bacterium]